MDTKDKEKRKTEGTEYFGTVGHPLWSIQLHIHMKKKLQVEGKEKMYGRQGFVVQFMKGGKRSVPPK